MEESSAPGRLNVIGEHVDYNDGFVLPFAINRRTRVKVSLSDRFEISSREMGRVVLKNVEKTGSWADYVLGVVQKLRERGYKIPPVSFQIESDVPIGMGLSSSAALEVATAFAIKKLLNFDLDNYEVLELTVKAEREFVGVKCGIMDQYTAIFAKKGFALLIDTMKISHEYVPLIDARFFVLDSGVKHTLASGEYNRRREETKRALEIIGKKSYRDVKLEDLEKLKDGTLRKRAEHVVREIDRTLKAAEAMRDGNLKELGEFLYESHESLSKLYEISCDETDFIVDFLRKRKVEGARMVGGGFGGGVIAITRREDINEIFEDLKKEYHRNFGIELGIMEVESDDGVY